MTESPERERCPEDGDRMVWVSGPLGSVLMCQSCGYIDVAIDSQSNIAYEAEDHQ